jgi:hypothetical protein
METPIIRYNLKDRGRRHTGQRRNFDIRAICDAINGPACQETVASRGMIGYYGHLPRVRYGLNPVEGGMEGGKYAPVEPALVTTHLKADYGGNVEHKAQFLDTASGKLAAKLWQNKVGGFSSAINADIPQFFGFDYVAQPNYLGNSFRGVALDDALGAAGAVVMTGAGVTYDDVYAAEQDERVQSMIAVLDGLNAQRARAGEVIEHLRAENEQLLSMLAQKGLAASAALDAAAPIAPLAVSATAAERLRRDARSFFDCAELPGFAAPAAAQTGARPSPGYRRLLGQYSRRG